MLYTLNGITKEYGNRKVLDAESLKIPAGKITALLGPNGAGKTTLLSILAFLSYPTRGSMTYDSREVRFAQSHVQPLRREVVLINQHPIMFSRTVARNMEFGLKLRGMAKEQRETIIRENLSLVGLEHFAQARAHKLSGGETQRIAIARALALSPKVILCDEPLSSVDSQNQAIIVGLLRRINKDRGISVIFTSHDSVWARSLAHEVLYLDEGRPVDSVLENIFSGDVVKNESGETVFVSGEGVGFPLSGASPGPARVSLDPSGLEIFRPGSSGRSPESLYGRIHQLSHEKKGIRVVIDAGLPFTVLLSENDYKFMCPKIGDMMGIKITPKAIRILGG
ncbi:MAG: ATP-binding cassette domain-containing protein [Desulfatibacillum sp.]|nr:ATP-binding cassette domain-containing protein [Desulfatibacillum sp.]